MCREHLEGHVASKNHGSSNSSSEHIIIEYAQGS